MIKGSIQEDIAIINICAPNIGAPQYVRQMLTSMKGEINNSTIIVGDFNTPSHLWVDRPNRKLNGNGTIPINNYPKCKWVECPNQKTKTG